MTGERKLLREMFSNQVQFVVSGEGFTWETQDKDRDIAMDMFLQYETYYNDLLKTHIDPVETMSIAIFDKFNINDCQSDLLKRKNEPNPVLFNELKKLLNHFIWNWDEFLEKCKVVS